MTRSRRTRLNPAPNLALNLARMFSIRPKSTNPRKAPVRVICIIRWSGSYFGRVSKRISDENVACLPDLRADGVFLSINPAMVATARKLRFITAFLASQTSSR